MAGEIKISALPLAGAATDSDVTAGVQSGTTVKQTNSALATYMKGKIDLNSAYAVTPSFTLNITSGLSILGRSLVVANTTVTPDGSAIFEIDSTTQGFLLPRMTATQMNAIPLPSAGLEVFNTTASAPYYYSGSAWIPSNGSSLTIQGTTNQINVGLVGSTYTLSTPQNINTTANFQSGTLGVNLASTLDLSAVFEIDSTTKGMLPPRGTQTQRGNISSPATGLQFYNTTSNTNDYFDGAQWQQGLALGHVIQGTNMNIVDNGNGTMTFSSSGGGSAGTQVQGSFVAAANASTTSVTTSDSPINISGVSLQVLNAVGTSVTASSVSGVTTPIIQNTSSGGRWGFARFDLTMNIQVSGSLEYTFTVYTNRGSTTYFKNFTLSFTPGTEKDFSFCSPLVFLNTNDYVYLAVACNTGSTSFIARNFQGSWIDTTIASLPSTDALIQGSDNTYLSQNGGLTYEYLSGSATVGNLAEFNTTGGQLIDSGILASNVVLNNSGTYNINISGNAATATSAGSAADINTSVTSANTNFFIPMVANSSGVQQVFTSSPLFFNPSSGLMTFTNLKLTGLTAFEAVVSDGVGNLISLPYTNANTASSLVERDSSGNFSAGTITAALNGNASTVTTNANLTGDVTSVGNASTLAASGIGKVIAITTVSGSSQAMSDSAPINRYLLTNTALCTLTLPSSPTVGHSFEIIGGGNQRWIIAQNASQFITTSVTGSIVSTTAGTGGMAGGSNNTDCITLVYAGSNKFVIQSEQTSGTGIILN